MSDYVTRCKVAIDGADLPDFKRFAENERVVSKEVPLMNKTGYAAMTPRYGFELDYVVPVSGREYDFDGVSDAVVAIEKDGGRRIVFSGVRIISIGESVIDGENEEVRTATFGATSRKEE